MSVSVAKGLAGHNLWALLPSSDMSSIYHMVGDVLGIEASHLVLSPAL